MITKRAIEGELATHSEITGLQAYYRLRAKEKARREKHTAGLIKWFVD